MAILDDIKIALRVSGTDLDSEINDLISAAKYDLTISGINADKKVTVIITPEQPEEDPSTIEVIDPLIKRAIVLYCKAHFGYDDMAARFSECYDSLKQHLALSIEYQVGDTS